MLALTYCNSVSLLAMVILLLIVVIVVAYSALLSVYTFHTCCLL